MRPKVAVLAILLFGFAKLAQLKMLKNSVRNSPLTLSLKGTNLTTEKSMFFCPGPRKKLRGVLPKGWLGSKAGLLTTPTAPPARIGREITNAPVLKYWLSLSLTSPDPSTEPLKAGLKLARWMMLLFGLSIIEKGRPVCNVRMPATSQLLRMA